MTQNYPDTGGQLGSTKRLRNAVVSLGVLLVLAGLSLNKWSIERIFLADDHLDSSEFIAAIVIFQILCIVSGVWLLLRKPALPIPIVVHCIVVFCLAAGVLFGGYGNLRALHIINPHREMLELFRAINASEELHLALTPRLNGLGKSVMNLEFPDNQSYELFDDHVTVGDFGQLLHVLVDHQNS